MLSLETDLQGATAYRELEVYYQPITSLERGQLVGFEALLRWHHPTLGLVAPVEFIPTAEETGLIIELDRWVLKQACAQLRRWQQSLLFPLTLNVNLSSRQSTRSRSTPRLSVRHHQRQEFRTDQNHSGDGPDARLAGGSRRHRNRGAARAPEKVGCVFGQGYMFSKPLTEPEATAFLITGTTVLPVTPER